MSATVPAFRPQKFPTSWPEDTKLPPLQSLVGLDSPKPLLELQALEFEFLKATSDTDLHVSSLQSFPRTDTDIGALVASLEEEIRRSDFLHVLEPLAQRRERERWHANSCVCLCLCVCVCVL